MKKEHLTRKDICKDLNVINNNKLAYHFTIYIYFAILFICVGLLVWALTKIPILGIMVWFIPVPHIAFQFCLWIVNRHRIANKEFTIESETLITKTKKLKYMPRIRRLFAWREVSCLHFSSGNFMLPDKLYLWSENCLVKDNDIENTSSEGSQFYIAMYKNGKIGCVYNKDYFELKI